MIGKDRCKLHGGKTPASQNRGETNGNHKYGLYAAALTDSEAAAWDAVPLGAVDHEIRMCKVWLARAMVLDHTLTKPPAADGTELAEVRRSSSDDGMIRTDTVSKRPDTMGRINMLVGRIAQLEKTRSEMIAQAQAAGEGAGDKARDLIETIRAIEQVEQVVQADDADETGRDE